jgi:hypothetical protein
VNAGETIHGKRVYSSNSKVKSLRIRKEMSSHRGHRDNEAKRGGLVKSGAEFEDTGTGGFDWDGEGEPGTFVEEEDYAVKFAFADAAGQGEANRIEEIATADPAGFLQVCGDFLKALGGKGSGLEQEQGEMADDVSGGVTRDSGLGVGGLQDSGGVVVEDGPEEIGEGGAVFGIAAKEFSGAVGPGELFGCGIGAQPVVFAEKSDDVGYGIPIWVRRMLGAVVVEGHGESLV